MLHEGGGVRFPMTAFVKSSDARQQFETNHG